MTKIKSIGKCLFCDKTFAKVGINRHLQKHLTDKILQNMPGKSFLLKIEIIPDGELHPIFYPYG